MNQPSRMVVQTARLRDQVYDIVREEILSGAVRPGERLQEANLAAKYGVSRTPIREALFQLAREGLLVNNKRSYSLPIDTPSGIRDRIEVHLLIGPAIASHAALEGTDEQIKALGKILTTEKQAEATGDFHAFAAANFQFHKTLRLMCSNVPLVRCSALLEEQFLFARNELYRLPEHRAIATRHDERVLRAVRARDAKLAARMVQENMEELAKRFANWTPDSQPDADQERRAPRRARTLQRA